MCDWSNFLEILLSICAYRGKAENALSLVHFRKTYGTLIMSNARMSQKGFCLVEFENRVKRNYFSSTSFIYIKPSLTIAYSLDVSVNMIAKLGAERIKIEIL